MIENNMLFYGRVLKQLLQAYDDSVSLELMKEFEALIQMQVPSNDAEPSSNEDDLMRQLAENYATATIEELKKSVNTEDLNLSPLVSETNARIEKDGKMIQIWLLLRNAFLQGVKESKNIKRDEKITTDYNAIDLGLPSGLKWSDRNVGAEKETDYGLYFQWGDTVGYADASHSTWETCPGNGGNSSYNAKSIDAWDAENLQSVTGMEYSTKILKPSVDAATVNMGSKWRMPTFEDCAELLNNTNYEYAVIEGVKGGKFINKNDPSKYIFLPFAGYAVVGSFEGQGIEGNIWSSSVYSDSPAGAYYVGADESVCDDYADSRCIALSVRGVC